MMKVLVTQFVKEIQDHIAAILEKEGYVLDITDSGKVGLDLACQNKYQFIIANSALFDMPGLLMIKKMREKGIDCPIFVYTARCRWQDAIMTYMAGADYYASIPLHDHEFLSCIKEMMTGQDSEEIIIAREKMLSTDKTNGFNSDMNVLISEDKEWLPDEIEQEWADQEKQRLARRACI